MVGVHKPPLTYTLCCVQHTAAAHVFTATAAPFSRCPDKRKTHHLPLSVTATTGFLHRPALSARVFGLYFCRFTQPRAARFWARFPIHSAHFLPLLAGTWPFIKRPVTALRFDSSGAMYNSQLITYVFRSVTALLLVLRRAKAGPVLCALPASA